MEFETVWRELREQCELARDDVLVTPSKRAFVVAGTGPERVDVEFVDTGRGRTLRRRQFEVLHDRLTGEGTPPSVEDAPAGVEPYLAVLSLSSHYAAEGDELRYSEAGEAGESPFLRPEWTARTVPERVHDDAALLVDLLERHDVGDDLDALDVETLVDLYVLLSDVQRGADGLRRTAGDHLLPEIGPDGRRHGRYGTVRRTTRERRHLKDESTVRAALEAADIPREWVTGVDRQKLDVVLSVTDLDATAVYDVEQQVYVQKTGVEEAEKQSRLQGLRERLAALDAEDAAALRADLRDLEDRLERVLGAG